MSNRKYNSQRKLSFQQLEGRQLMAANVLAVPAMTSATVAPAAPAAPAEVSAYVSKGVLTITGDGGNDAVTINQPANSPNEFVLTSSNGTLLNGQTKLDFKGVTGAINVNFRGVAESLTVGAESIPANLNVNMGNGTNSVYIDDVNVHGGLSITGGSGTDYVKIQESTIGSANVNGGANDLTIMLGGGVNGIQIEHNVTVQRDLNILDPSSAGDNILLGDAINAGRYVYINAGNASNCNNSITLGGVTAGGQVNIQTGGGQDKVYLGGTVLGEVDPVIADSIYLNLGAGNDLLQIGGDSNSRKAGGVFAAHGATYNGGAGYDIYYNESYNSLSGLTGFEWGWAPPS